MGGFRMEFKTTRSWRPLYIQAYSKGCPPDLNGFHNSTLPDPYCTFSNCNIFSIDAVAVLHHLSAGQISELEAEVHAIRVTKEYPDSEAFLMVDASNSNRC